MAAGVGSSVVGYDQPGGDDLSGLVETELIEDDDEDQDWNPDDDYDWEEYPNEQEDDQGREPVCYTRQLRPLQMSNMMGLTKVTSIHAFGLGLLAMLACVW